MNFLIPQEEHKEEEDKILKLTENHLYSPQEFILHLQRQRQ